MTKKPINAFRKNATKFVAKQKTPAVIDRHNYVWQSRPINAILNNLYQQELHGQGWEQ